MSSKNAQLRKRIRVDAQVHMKYVREKFLKAFSEKENKPETGVLQ